MDALIAVLRLMEGGVDCTFKETFLLVYVSFSHPLFLNPFRTLHWSLEIVKK